MSIKQLLTIALIFIGFGFAFGHSVGTDQQVKINESLQTEYNELKQNYDTLQTQCDRDLSTCRTLLSDLQNRVQKGQVCYVDGGNNCE